MKSFINYLFSATALCLSVTAVPLDFGSLVEKRADSSLVGYFGTFFLGDQPKVYFYSSNGNDPTSFKVLNGGEPVLVPTTGTLGVRDPAIVVGGGIEAGKKWYIIGTDLNIATTDWDTAQRKGSLKIYVWESTDLITWTNERLLTVEDNSAGMVWAPEASWSPEKGQYLVYWSSKFYPASDPDHTGSPGKTKIRSAYTSDFITFSEPEDYVAYDYNIIDLSILHLGGDSYARFIKAEDVAQVFTETTTGGLNGTWTRPAGVDAIIDSGVEGPAAYLDNEVEGKAHLLLDHFGSTGYAPYESTDVTGGIWTKSDSTNFPVNLRHGAVLPVDQEKYDAINTKWG